MASRGASVTVVGQTFRDSEVQGVEFIKARLTSATPSWESTPLKSRFTEWIIGLLNPSAETYVERLTPLLVSPDLELHSGAMFDRKGFVILPSPKLTDRSYVKAFIAASEELVSRANVRVSS